MIKARLSVAEENQCSYYISQLMLLQTTETFKSRQRFASLQRPIV